MLQKKREKYQQEIRNKQLQNYFKRRRTALVQPPIENIRMTLSTSPLSQALSQQIHLLMNVMTKDYNYGLRLLQELHSPLQTNSLQATLSILQNFPFVLIQVAKNQEKLNEWVKLPQNYQLTFLGECLSLVTAMQFNQTNFGDLHSLLDALWEILGTGLLNKQIRGQTLLLMWLKSIQKIQNGGRQAEKALIQRGLKEVVAKRAEEGAGDAQAILLQVMEGVLRFEQGQGKGALEIGGVHIIGQDSTQKQRFLAYCLYLIQGQRQHLIATSLNCIILILENHEYLSESIAPPQLMVIGKLVLHKFSAIQSNSLELLDDLLYYSPSVADCLLSQMFLPNILLNFLRLRPTPQPENIRKAARILCNLSLTDKKQLRVPFQKHAVWSLAYQSISPGNPLLPLVITFEYFFDMVGRRTVLRILDAYLGGLTQLEWQYLDPEITQAIQRTVMRVYVRAKEDWDEDSEKLFWNMIQGHRMHFLLRDVMEEEPPL